MSQSANRRILLPTSAWRPTLAAALLLTAAGVWWLPAGPGFLGGLQQILVFALLWLWPAITWQAWLPGEAALRWLTAAALALLVNGLGALLLHYLPGPPPRLALFLLPLFLAALPLLAPGLAARARALSWRDLHRPGTRALLLLAALFLLALWLRATNLGYKELQGDEGVILTRAAAALQGDDAELFLHQKGPVEILLPLLTWGVAGSATENWLRLPFLWASLLALAAVMRLAWTWLAPADRQWRWPVTLLAGLLFAGNGLTVAFGRIIQYQSLVMLWGSLAVLYAARHRAGGRWLDLCLTAAFLGGGLLAHYDAVLVTPAIAFLLLVGMAQRRDPRPGYWAAALALGAAILALFYLPFALDESFAGTLQYLINDRVGAGDGGGLLRWSGPQAWRMATFYGSTYMVLLLLLGWLLALFAWRAGAWLTPIAAWLHLLAPLLFYTLVVADARTHVYTILPAATYLAAAGLVWLWEFTGRRSPILQRPLAVLGALPLLAALLYVVLMFVDVTPERQRTWAENRPVGFPTSWTMPPQFGLFGFPYQAGWRSVADLLPADAYPYASNEEQEITDVYLAQAPRTHCANFNSFILAQNVQDEIPFDPALLADWHLWQQVTVSGRETLQIWRPDRPAGVATVAADDSARWLTPAQVAPPRPTPNLPLDVTLGDQVRLLGADISARSLLPGERLVVTLYWEALAPFERNYQSFVHVWDGGSVPAQDDGAPECNIMPTTRWEPGQIIPDPHLIELPAGLPADQYTLLTGMYDLLTVVRLPVPGVADATVDLGAIIIRPQP